MPTTRGSSACLISSLFIQLHFLATLFQRKVACFVNNKSDLHLWFDEVCLFRPPVTFTGVWALIIEKLHLSVVPISVQIFSVQEYYYQQQN